MLMSQSHVGHPLVEHGSGSTEPSSEAKLPEAQLPEAQLPEVVGRDILIVDDEPSIRTMMAFMLARHGYQYFEAPDVASARQVLCERRPDLILLDRMLPDMDGVVYLRALRSERNTRDIPVIVLSARATESDRAEGLEGGADDYITKPFSPRELIARIEALLRRCTRRSARAQDDCAAMELLIFADLVLEPLSHRVRVAGRNCALGPTEYRLLQFFLTHVGRTFRRDELIEQIRGVDAEVGRRTIDVHIRRLRAALAPFEYDQFIQTVHGTGYRLSALPA